MSNVNTSYVLDPNDALVSGLNLRASYLFNEASGTTVFERSGQTTGVDGTVNANGQTVTWLTGDSDFGTALSLIPGSPGLGTGATVVVPNDNHFNTETYTLCMGLRSNYNTNNGGYSNMAIKYSSGKYPFGLYVDLGGLGAGLGYPHMQVWDGSTVISLNGTSSITDSAAHQIIMRRRAQNDIRLYIDGVLHATASDTLSAGATINSADISFGDNQASLGTGFKGVYSYIHFWSDALSDGGISAGSAATGQIADLFANPLRMFAVSPFGQYWP